MIRLFFIILVFNFLVGCKTMKEGFSLQKKQAADEFLVEKKNPLVQPQSMENFQHQQIKI